MKKDFAEKKFAAKRTSQIRLRWLLLFFCVLVVSVSVTLIVKYKHSSVSSTQVASYFQRMKSWLADHSKRSPKSPVEASVKTKEPQEDSQAPIHFEFYTALSSMQVSAPEPELKTPVAPVVTKPVVTKQVMTKTISHVKSALPIVNANELEQEVSDQIKSHAYMVQLGVFKNVEIAERFSATLTQSGFDVRIAKWMSGKKAMYRVQLGPFANKQQAKMLQQQLEKKGINGIIKSNSST